MFFILKCVCFAKREVENRKQNRTTLLRIFPINYIFEICTNKNANQVPWALNTLSFLNLHQIFGNLLDLLSETE